MKRFPLPLLPQLALVFAVVYACSDSTAPASSNALLVPKPAFLGDPPPPPVDVGMTISVNSPGSAVFTGVFFSNGKISDDGLSLEPTFDGTAWLRLNNKQPTPDVGNASPNTRFKRHDDDKSGMGTLTFVENGVPVTYTIVSVEDFTVFNNSDCQFNFQTCAHIDFTAKDKFGNSHDGHLDAFNVQGCTFVPVEGSGGYFSCPDGE